MPLTLMAVRRRGSDGGRGRGERSKKRKRKRRGRSHKSLTVKAGGNMNGGLGFPSTRRAEGTGG